MLHGRPHRRFNGAGIQAGAGDGVAMTWCRTSSGRWRRISRILPQLGGVGQIAVVGQGHIALDVTHQQGLGVGHALHAGGGVAAVADGHVAVTSFSSTSGVKIRSPGPHPCGPGSRQSSLTAMPQLS